MFDHPCDVCIDEEENLYIADAYNHLIRKIDTDGLVTSYAGSKVLGYSNDLCQLAHFSFPEGVLMHQGGIYVADCFNHCIRKIADGNVTNVAGSCLKGYEDGICDEARFDIPSAIAIDPKGDLYVAEFYGHRIRLISNGMVSTLSGNGQALYVDGDVTVARLTYPWGVALSGKDLYFTDFGSSTIRKIELDNEKAYNVTTITSKTKGYKDGPVELSEFNTPRHIAAFPGGRILVADQGNNRIREIKDGFVSTVYGDGTTTKLNQPSGMDIRKNGNIIIADTYNHRILELICVSNWVGSWPRVCPKLTFQDRVDEFMHVLHHSHIPRDVQIIVIHCYILLTQSLTHPWI
uniref:SMP-30/Gluconolactonase/LRE-like region domain-containing protein n=1 Tax=Arcella intermedia TaxID=1963864 RepID=A0A6B2L7Z5_9EUKA|eukprot:TRINITY_DN6518_c0_g1_i2.p1 TRINITY_DN6518_c0_g1~~TRINITY_DN6518_c0_g1_i2.p1  ORF type:complete len:385 (+),score=92.76 TRINITY_DN6518_c0_g1_i2:112-1155(+)